MRFTMVFLVIVAIIYFNYPLIAEKFNLPKTSEDLRLLTYTKDDLQLELQQKERALAAYKAAPRPEEYPSQMKQLEQDIKKLKETLSKR